MLGLCSGRNGVGGLASRDGIYSDRSERFLDCEWQCALPGRQGRAESPFCVGGAAHVKLSKADGWILKMIHYK